ncbi:MAG TPA: 2'-deoxycytidine 5'-triphosphate deaminase [Geminicoccaceae bacterium]|jgi:dCTP deaminase|nr:2'-deoxycytidine 5'-triphosphate deaminase [Geminicoccaceae bacterium]HZA67534.1 2'-deoxycytidine 5'-triphosphate deaminase [Geminicoccaceae bacterium]
MAYASSALLFEDRESTELEPRHGTGLLPAQHLKALIEQSREIRATVPIEPDQLQPASLDLRLGARVYRVRASFLPGAGATVQAKIDALAMHQFDLDDAGAVLEKGCVYIVPLLESLALKKRTSAIANPKSSIGRIDVFTRLITDRGTEFDRVRPNYHGPLYAEISPRTFSILVRKGDRLNQIRIKRGTPLPSDDAMRRLNERDGLVQPALEREDIKQGVPITVDLAGTGPGAVIGYRARKHAGLIDLRRLRHYAPGDFWHVLRAAETRSLVLDPGEFYILASKEAVRVPADHAAEMLAYDTAMGEFRVHYAGFFDPGFGHAEAGGEGTRAVLEVRSHEVPFMLEDGQRVGRLVYERLIAKPDRLYGAGIGSSYQRQGLTLSKHFK